MPDLDTCQPGDDMPADDDGPGLCGDTAYIRSRPFVCTRGPGHGLTQHVAAGPAGRGALLRVIATWDDGSDIVRVWDGT